jgi:hypothetical protein
VFYCPFGPSASESGVPKFCLLSSDLREISLPEESIKAQEYRIHIYPRDLARTIAAQWTIASDAAVSLPPEEELATFLSEAYQASLLREEDRPVNCRLILIDPSELSDNTGPPGGLQVLHLVDERKLREHEIRRLSPSATFYRSLIGVRWDPDTGFLIWGVINSGSRWINETDGGRLRSPEVPDRLIIHIRGPGNLIIFRGDRRIATLLTGKLQGSRIPPFRGDLAGKTAGSICPVGEPRMLQG